MIKKTNNSTVSGQKKSSVSIALFFFYLLVIGLLSFGCAKIAEKSGSSAIIEQLFPHYESGNYFKLRDGLREINDSSDLNVLFLQAVTQHAFNNPEKSNQIIEELSPLESSLPDTLAKELRSLKIENHLRLSQYRMALEAAKDIIQMGGVSSDSAAVANAQNISKMFTAIADVPQQKVVSKKTTTLKINRDKAGLQRIPVSIKGTENNYVLDTGANYSVIMQSEADKLGLEVKKAGFEVNSSTGGKVQADVAVADHLALGDVVYQNVVFLVFPDEALSFPQIDYRIPAIIGFTLIEAAGEIRFLQDDVLEIPAQPLSLEEMNNMALKGLEPRVQVGLQISATSESALQVDSLVCSLDTGASSTNFSAEFYKRYRLQVKQLGQQDTLQVGGAGGARNMPIFRIPKLQLNVGNATAILENIAIHTESISPDNNGRPACNIGQDVLGQFEETIMNYKSMSLLLRK